MAPSFFVLATNIGIMAFCGNPTFSIEGRDGTRASWKEKLIMRGALTQITMAAVVCTALGGVAALGAPTLAPDVAAQSVLLARHAPLHAEAAAGTHSAFGQPIGGAGGYPIGALLWEYEIDTSWDNSPKAIAPIPDVNDDGIDDVIVCSEDDHVRCFSGAALGTGVVLWEHEIYSGDVYSQLGLDISADVNGDGYCDVVVGSAWGGRLVRMICGYTGDEIWTHDTHEYGDGGWVYQVNCRYDYNDDGVPDVLAATGDDSGDIGPKRVYCLNAIDGISIWERPLGGPVFSVIGVEDFTGDGQPDVLAGASNSSETDGKAYGIDGADGALKWTFTTNGSSVWGLAQVGDITGDGVNDVMAGDFSGYIYGLDATDGSQEYVRGGYGIVVRLQPIEDVNADGHPEVVPGHSGTTAAALSGETGLPVWSRALADKAWNVARSDDLNGDQINDVLVGTLYTNNYCYFLDGADGEVLHSIAYPEAVDAINAIPDVTGDGSMEMVAGGRGGLVRCFSGGLGVDPCAGQVRGDADCDGTVNSFDIDPFVLGLTDLAGWESAYPDCDWECVLDVNCDGLINSFDIDPFVLCLTEGCPPCP